MTSSKAQWRFTCSQPLTYPEHGVHAAPGDVHEWPDGPPTDGNWTKTTTRVSPADTRE